MALLSRFATILLWLCAAIICFHKVFAAEAAAANATSSPDSHSHAHGSHDALTGMGIRNQVLLAITVGFGVIGGLACFAIAMVLCGGILPAALALCSGCFDIIFGPRGVEAASLSSTRFTSSMTTSAVVAATGSSVNATLAEEGIQGDICYAPCYWPNTASARLLNDLQAHTKVILSLLLLFAFVYFRVAGMAAQSINTVENPASTVIQDSKRNATEGIGGDNLDSARTLAVAAAPSNRGDASSAKINLTADDAAWQPSAYTNSP